MAMYFLYGAITFAVVVFIYGTLTRRKIYREVDRLEEWKIDIMNRPITDEIGRVKGLKMSGETEEKFEVWRAQWDKIIDTSLPDIEETLFDVEEAANKYRFKKARQLLVQVEKELEEIESILKKMIQDINGLILSEEKNRVEIDDVRGYYTEIKKYFHLHRSSMGKAALKFEERLDKLYKTFVEFEEATTEGNYIKAREILLATKETLDQEHLLMQEIPVCLVQINNNIPSEINNLLDGIKEMEDIGYNLSEFTFEERIEEIAGECEDVLDNIENIEMDQIPDRIENITKRIELMYEDLEHEVNSKFVVEQGIAQFRQQLEETNRHIILLQKEVDTVQQSYRISKEELHFHVDLTNKLSVFAKRLGVIADLTLNQKQAFTTIETILNQLQEEFQEFHLSIESFKEKLAMLREEELKAKDTLKRLKSKVLEGKRKIQKSNIPGLPVDIIEEMAKAERKLTEVDAKLAEIPLEMQTVNVKVNEAVSYIDSSNHLIETTIEKAVLAERLIQYGNRYRTRSSKVDEQLSEAELCFRSYYYDDAIELAASSIEKYDSTIHAKLKHAVEEKV